MHESEKIYREDCFAVAVRKSGETVGHFPIRNLCICSLFLQHGRSIACRITGHRRNSKDLPQGGLEVPCIYTFSGSMNMVEKTGNRLVELKVPVSQMRNPLVSDGDCVPPYAVDLTPHSPQATAAMDNVASLVPPVTPTVNADVWTEVMDIKLTQTDKTLISDGSMLTDQYINCAQRFLHQQFPHLGGLRSTLMQAKPFRPEAGNIVQIFHVQGNHWIAAASQKGKTVKVYDSS